MDNTLNFTEFIGLEKVQKAIEIALVSPKVGSLLIAGKTGTGKSALLHSIKSIVDELPIHFIPQNIEEDMLLGTIDLDKTLNSGAINYKTGLLGRDDHAILLLDNANLINTTTLKHILNAQELGYYQLEREGFSATIPSTFNFIASYTLDSSEPFHLKVQDFSMYVETAELTKIQDRVKLLQQIIHENTNKEISEKLLETKTRIFNARNLYFKVEVTDNLLLLASKYCEKTHCEGNHTELYLIAVSKAIAALANRTYVLPKDLDEACLYVLPHQGKPPAPAEDLSDNNDENSNSDTEQDPQDNSNNQTNSEQEENLENNSQDSTPQNNTGNSTRDAENDSNAKQEQEDNSNNSSEQQNPSDMSKEENTTDEGIASEEIYDIDKNVSLPSLAILPSLTHNLQATVTGKRKGTYIESPKGKYRGVRLPYGKIKNLALLPTIKAAAPFQKLRSKGKLAINIKPQDYREKVLTRPLGNAFIFLVDASGSMGAKKRMTLVKGAILEMLKDAYVHRDAVSLIVFRKENAEVLLPLTNSIELAHRKLQEMPTGGKTPLHEGLATAYDMIYRFKAHQRPVLILITDGKVNGVKFQDKTPWEQAKFWGEKIGDLIIPSLVIDTNNDFIKLHLAEELAEIMGSKYYSLKQLTKLSLITLARETARHL